MLKIFCLIVLSSLVACAEKSSEPSVVVSASASLPESENLVFPEFIAGHYNHEDKYWESTDKQYETSSMSDPEYSQVSRYDAEGNSLGMGIINKEGKVIVKPIYDGMYVGFTDGVCKVSLKDKWGLVNEKGEEIVAPQYDYISPQAAIDGLLNVRIGELEGYIDLTGTVIIPIQYASTEIAGEGMIAVMNEPQKWGYINYQNKLIIPMQFWSPAPFEKGKATRLQKDEGEFTVYTDGRIEQTKKW